MARRGLTVIDVLVALVALALLTAFGLAQAIQLDSAEARAQCQSNLQQIGQALWEYSVSNRGRFPVVESDPEHPVPTCGTPYEDDPSLSGARSEDERGAEKFRPKPNDVTAALYLAVSQQGLPIEFTVCPATRQTPWDFEGNYVARDWTNWKGKAGLREHLSYSYHNPYPAKDARFRFLNNIDERFVIAADLNPGSDSLTKVNVKSPEREMRRANSANHSREGQNVLYGDRHVAFERTVFVGMQQDNIYTFGPSGAANPASGGDGVLGPPSAATDTVLLPTARELAMVDADGNWIESQKPSAADKTAPTSTPTTPTPHTTPASVGTTSMRWLPLLMGFALIAIVLLLFLLTIRSGGRKRGL